MDENEDPEGGDQFQRKPQNISLNVIVKRHFSPDAASWPHERIVEELNKITHVRLDRERIASIENLLLFSTNVTNVYLQHNLIEKLDGLECLSNVKFITLSFNKIKAVQGLNNLCRLCFLDLSHNQISSFCEGDFPKSLMMLNLKENPCVTSTGYRSSLLQSLPRLTQLDEVSIRNDDDSGDDENADVQTLSSSSIDEVTVSLHTAASDILDRSQRSLELQYSHHKRRLQQLDDFRSASPSPLSSDSPLS